MSADTLVALIILAVIFLAAIGTGVSVLIEKWAGVPVRIQEPAPPVAMPVSPQQDAVRENAESGKPAGPTPAELDRMIRTASDEAVARAIGRIAGLGYLQPGTRSKALLAAGIEGRRYQALKTVVDAAQSAAQAEEPAEPEPPRAVAVHAGRPDERLVEL